MISIDFLNDQNLCNLIILMTEGTIQKMLGFTTPRSRVEEKGYSVTDLGKPFFFKRSKYGDCPEGGGGFNPCPNFFGALFYVALYLGKMPKGGEGG